MQLFELNPREKMKALINQLNEAADVYYNDGSEIMSDREYDELLEKLRALEESTGIILPDSPTINVGAPVKIDKLLKVEHVFPALSLDKTKDIDQILKTFNVTGKDPELVVLMWKLDGSTVQLTYDSGKLILAATRGDGHIGQNITHNAPYIDGIPLEVKDKSKFTVRGEAVISYSDFEKINANLPEGQKFKNPRNLAAASITMLDPNDMKDRHIQFKAFELVDHPLLKDRSTTIGKSFYCRLNFCGDQGFGVVPNSLESVHPEGEIWQLRHDLEYSDPSMCDYYLPVDGMVIAYDNVEYTDDLEGTEHHPNILKGYAYKWRDEIAKTTLRKIEWSPSRTGLLNPVAIFDSVELEGTTVSRASLHNVSILKELHLNPGDVIEVQKANKIIPQVVHNLSEYSGLYKIPECFKPICPSCEQEGVITYSDEGVASAYCINQSCSAKLIYKFEHYCERTSMNIEGLSEATIEKFVKLGYLEKFADIYNLDLFKEDIIELEGFGDKSWDNLWAAIQKSRNTTMPRFLTALGIPNVGVSQAKAISQYFNGDIDEFLHAKYLDFSVIPGIGPAVSKGILTWLHDEFKWIEAFDTVSFLNFKTPEEKKLTLEGMTFVITGSLNHFKNRKELELLIESNSGQISSSVSQKTTYLINNNAQSNSSKNKKAHELGVPIINEAQFIKLLEIKEI